MPPGLFALPKYSGQGNGMCHKLGEEMWKICDCVKNIVSGIQE